jgi:hypothetical protein
MNAEHTCTLDSNFHRHALQRGGRLKLDLEGMKSILLLLWEQTRLDTCTLCPYLEKFLPHYKGVTAQFICNFRTRVFNYFARKGPYEELTMEEAQALFSKSQCAADETVDTDDPIIHKNVTNILRKIMTEDLGTWKALAYLEECKSQYPGFDIITKRALGVWRGANLHI